MEIQLMVKNSVFSVPDWWKKEIPVVSFISQEMMIQGCWWHLKLKVLLQALSIHHADDAPQSSKNKQVRSSKTSTINLNTFQSRSVP